MLMNETPACWANHLGLWCIEPLWFAQAVALYKAGLYAIDAVVPRGREMRHYDVVDGVAVVPIHGPMTKAGSFKFQETSTVQIRQHLREASRDDDVSQVMLHVYSPGGHVDGTHELAADVARIGQQKPVFAHIEDLGASAAYWVASQAQRITANATAEVGSIGTVAVLEDTSKRMDRLGVEVHVISTGPYKGAGVDGAPLSAEALSYFRGRVESLNEHFLAAVQRGRGMTAADIDRIRDGRVHIASVAESYGLINAVQSFDDALEQAKQGSLPLPQAQRPSLPPGRSPFGQRSASHRQTLALGARL